MHRLSPLLLFVAASLFHRPHASVAEVHGFDTHQLSDEFYAEGAAFADFNKDGHLDVTYGPFWFAGPTFKKRHLVYPPNKFEVVVYSNNFLTYADDLDHDGWTDILVLGFPGKKAETYWMKNPGEGKFDQLWERFEVFDGVDNESPVWGDVTGDGQNEILCSRQGQFGFVHPSDRKSPQAPWTFTPITPPNTTGGKFTHGLGFGDVNGDGKNDLLEKTGWWEQPEKGLWIKHAYPFAPEKGGSQMYAYDFDADGDQDIISSINAHGYGLAWFEQIKDAKGGITFKKHPIMGTSPKDSRYGLSFSQLHAMKLEDIDGDSIKDLVTGKRYYAHRGKDPGGKDTPVIYWFRTVRGAEGSVDFVPYLIHDASGVGTDFAVGDVNMDGKPDIIIGNKKGCFVHLQNDTLVPAPTPTQSTAPQTAQAATSQQQIFEGESLEIVQQIGKLRPQRVKDMGTGTWSGDSQIWWTEAKPGEVIVFALPISVTGKYRIAAAMTKARDYGIVDIALDGKKLSGPIDLYNDGVLHTGDVVLGENVPLSEGEHRLTVTITGANPLAEQKYMFGLDYLSLSEVSGKTLPPIIPPTKKPPPPAKKANVKTGNQLDGEARSGEEQQKSFILPEDFVIELVASEASGIPKPVSLNFDDAGRLWTQTATMYPIDNNNDIWTKPGADRIVIIDEPHRPGVQTARTFAEGMVMPMGVLPYKNGAFIAQGPEILFLDDTNGNGTADQRTVLLKGFGVQDTHTLPHQLVRLPGGRIGFSQGVLNGGVVTDASGRSHSFDKTIIASFLPDGTDLRVIGTGMNNIWSWAQDRLGRVFIHEANDWGYAVTPFEEDTSYPSFVFTKIHPDAPLHPATAQDLNLGGTGFSGIAICDDPSGAFPASWRGMFLVANPILGKIHAVRGTQDATGVWTFTKHAELVVSSDPMFRPVAISFGPDGSLYIADWYNRIISHNEVARDHAARDKVHGRIWRVRSPSATQEPVKNISALPTQQLPSLLRANNTWAMRAAWHQIAERQDHSLIPEIKKMIGDDQTPPDVRIAALWSLEELDHFDPIAWRILLQQAEPNLRREAVRALSTLHIPQTVAAPLLKELRNETAWTVRYEILRYFRRAKGPIADDDLAWLRTWSATKAPTTKVRGTKGETLALDGSYQRGFQDFLLKLAETKTALPVLLPSKWNKVIDHHPAPADPEALAQRISAVAAALPHADPKAGRAFTEGLCLTCHALGGKGIGFAPPLDGSSNRDLEGLITAIVHPNAAMENVFRSFRVVTKKGATSEGFKLGETRRELSLQLMGGATQKFATKDIQSAGFIEGRSVMPDITGGMSVEQIAQIVAYLRSL